MPKDIHDFNTPEEFADWMKEMAKKHAPPPKNMPSIKVDEEKPSSSKEKRPEIFDLIDDLKNTP